MSKRLHEIHRALMDVTAGCSPDMHEPDEGLKVRIVGDHLDNASGAHIDAKAIVEGYQEFVVCFEWFDGKEIVYRQINLADLIALARHAVK